MKIAQVELVTGNGQDLLGLVCTKYLVCNNLYYNRAFLGANFLRKLASWGGGGGRGKGKSAD